MLCQAITHRIHTNHNNNTSKSIIVERDSNNQAESERARERETQIRVWHAIPGNNWSASILYIVASSLMCIKLMLLPNDASLLHEESIRNYFNCAEAIRLYESILGYKDNKFWLIINFWCLVQTVICRKCIYTLKNDIFLTSSNLNCAAVTRPQTVLPNCLNQQLVQHSKLHM